MYSQLKFVLLLLIGVSLAGCAQAGLFAAANLTQVELSTGNYRIVTTNIHGESEAAYLLGASLSSGIQTQTLALWRVKGSGLLYKEAMEDLWKNYVKEHGRIAAKKLALVNVRYDADNLNLLLYTRAKLSIRADVVEFIDSAETD